MAGQRRPGKPEARRYSAGWTTDAGCTRIAEGFKMAGNVNQIKGLPE